MQRRETLSGAATSHPKGALTPSLICFPSLGLSSCPHVCNSLCKPPCILLPASPSLAFILYSSLYSTPPPLPPSLSLFNCFSCPPPSQLPQANKPTARASWRQDSAGSRGRVLSSGDLRLRRRLYERPPRDSREATTRPCSQVGGIIVSKPFSKLS